ncbi:unnamed protein product [Parajaminaea phylloscopi]
MSLLNATLKLAIACLNLLDVYKALSDKRQKTAAPLSDLGKSSVITWKTVRDASAKPIRQPQTRYRVGSSQRRERLKGALSLAIVWYIFQSLEALCDPIATYVIPFYGTFKTCVLLWLFFARTVASTWVVKGLLQPIVGPYERIIDPLLATVLSLSFNAMFLASLPVFWIAIRARDTFIKVKEVFLGSLSSSDSNASRISHPSIPGPPVSLRMPPPTRKARRSSGVHRTDSDRDNIARGPGGGGPSIRKQSIHPSVHLDNVKAQGGQIVSQSAAKSSQEESHPSQVDSNGNMKFPPTKAPTATGPNPSSLGDQSFTKTQGVSGGFALIPDSPSQRSSVENRLNDASGDMALPLSPFTPSVFPGSFTAKSAPGPNKRLLKMPSGAKATPKKTRSSTSVKPAFVPPSVIVAGPREVVSPRNAPATVEASPDSSRTAVSKSSAHNIAGLHAQPPSSAKRRRRSPSPPVSMASPSEKKTKLDVFEDPSDGGHFGMVADEVPARRTRRALASRSGSRAASVVVEEGEDQKGSDASPPAPTSAVKQNGLAKSSRLPRSTAAAGSRKTSSSSLRTVLAPRQEADVAVKEAATETSNHRNGTTSGRPRRTATSTASAVRDRTGEQPRAAPAREAAKVKARRVPASRVVASRANPK